MNCNCIPPKHAVSRISTKPTSAGKEYFVCPVGACKFFTWAGAYMPMSIAFRNGGGKSGYNRGSNDNSHNRSPQKNGKQEAKLMIYEIITGPPVQIWLSMQAPSSAVVNDLFSVRLPQDKCKFSQGLKMWLFSLELYDRIAQEFLTPPFESIHLVDLPKSLAKGLRAYQKRLNKLDIPAEPVLNLSDHLRATLLPFQLDAGKFVVRRGGRALLGDDMGK